MDGGGSAGRAISEDGRQLKLFSGSSHPALTAEIAEFLGVSTGHARLQRFPDTECSFQIDENIRGTDVFVVQPTCARRRPEHHGAAA